VITILLVPANFLYVKLVVDLRETMSEAIEKMSKDIDILKNRLEEIDDKIDLIIDEKYMVKDEYVEKIKRILRNGGFEEFGGVAKLTKSIEQGY